MAVHRRTHETGPGTQLTEAERFEIADNIDRLMNADIVGRGFVSRIYPAARALAGRPLVQDAGDRLLERLQSNRRRAVLICTGATTQRPGLADYIGEMDGPPGAIVLARFIGLAFSALPVLITDAGQGPMLAAACRSLGMYDFSLKNLAIQSERSPHVSAVSIAELSDDDEQARAISEDLVTRADPVALVAIEKAGRNEKGVYHNSLKQDTSSCKARAERLFDVCHERGILTVGIGDGGNELGMGNVRDAILEAFPHMRKCVCPCGGSIAAEQKADSLIVAAVSNWGAYGLATYMAAVTGTPYAAHSPRRERDLLRGCARAGYVNIDGYAISTADGIPERLHVAFVALMSCIAHWPPLKYARAGVLGDMLAD